MPSTLHDIPGHDMIGKKKLCSCRSVVLDTRHLAELVGPRSDGSPPTRNLNFFLVKRLGRILERSLPRTQSRLPPLVPFSCIWRPNATSDQAIRTTKAT